MVARGQRSLPSAGQRVSPLDTRKACLWRLGISTTPTLKRFRHTEGRAVEPSADLYPRAIDALRSLAEVAAVAESGKADAAWVDAGPPEFRQN